MNTRRYARPSILLRERASRHGRQLRTGTRALNDAFGRLVLLVLSGRDVANNKSNAKQTDDEQCSGIPRWNSHGVPKGLKNGGYATTWNAAKSRFQHHPTSLSSSRQRASSELPQTFFFVVMNLSDQKASVRVATMARPLKLELTRRCPQRFALARTLSHKGRGQAPHASAPASCGTDDGDFSAGPAGSSAAATASSTRSSQKNSISRRAISGMSS
jgi:hypothetical protein